MKMSSTTFLGHFMDTCYYKTYESFIHPLFIFRLLFLYVGMLKNELDKRKRLCSFVLVVFDESNFEYKKKKFV